MPLAAAANNPNPLPLTFEELSFSIHAKIILEPVCNSANQMTTQQNVIYGQKILSFVNLMNILLVRWPHNHKSTRRSVRSPNRHGYDIRPRFQRPALVCSFGKGVKRRYGFTILRSGYCSFACSVLTLGCTMTSSPAEIVSRRGAVLHAEVAYLVSN